MAIARIKHHQHLEHIKAQIKQASTHLHMCQQRLLTEINTKEQECARLESRFETLKRDVLLLEEDLSFNLDKLQSKLDSLGAPHTWQTLQSILLATQKENLQKNFKLYGDYAAQSAQLEHDLKALSSSLPDRLQDNSDKPNSPQPSHSASTREVLIAPKYDTLLEHIKTLETQAQDFKNMQERLEQCQALHHEVVALEKILRQDLEALVIGYATLQPCIYALQAQSSYHIHDLDQLDIVFVQSCLQRLEQHWNTEQKLIERLQRELQESSSPAPHFNFTLLSLLPKLQQAIQNKTCDPHDFACSVLAVAMDTHYYLLFHLGDGMCGILENRQLKTMDCNTSTPKVFKGSVDGENVGGFVLLSSGATQYLQVASTLQDYMNVARVAGLQQKVQSALENLLETRVKEKTTDDCSVIMLVRESTEPLSPSEQKLKVFVQTPPSINKSQA